MYQYTALAKYYDRINSDIPYSQYAARISDLLLKSRRPVNLVLELACGTGSIGRLLSQKGFEMICVDSSPDMLSVAREKCEGLPLPPVFVCQDMCELDLYGTVQAAVCCLDSINYLEDASRLKRAFSQVSLFLEAGGLFIFDVKSTGMFEEMCGMASVFEDSEVFCAWQYGYDRQSRLAEHKVDIFEKDDETYSRFTEVHYQRSYSRLQLESALDAAGFKIKGVYHNYSVRKAEGDQGRLLFVAEKQ